MSPAFPVHELQYIVDQSGALMLLASGKFQATAQDVLREGLEHTPISVQSEKRFEGSQSYERVELEVADPKGGMMLYTSGTTNRPVCMVYNLADVLT